MASGHADFLYRSVRPYHSFCPHGSLKVHALRDFRILGQRAYLDLAAPARSLRLSCAWLIRVGQCQKLRAQLELALIQVLRDRRQSGSFHGEESD